MARSRPSTSVLVHAAVVALVGSIVGCSDRPAADVGSTGERGARVSQDEVDRIRALGYAGFGDDVDRERRGGVVYVDPARAWPGYNLTSVSKLCVADLFDVHGNVVHSWRDPDGRAWDHVELLEDGDLLVVGSDRGQRKFAGAVCEDHYVERFAFDGASRWKLPLRAHHDIHRLRDGNFMTLTATQRRLPAVDPAHDVVDNAFTILDGQGRVLEEHSLHDVFSKPGSAWEFQAVKPNPNKLFPIIDLFHANSIEQMRDPALAQKDPIYALDNVLVCMRHQDAIAIVDWREKRVAWSWGRGELSGPHDARVLPSGNIQVFDNGIDRTWTRVLEVDPLTKKIVWEYHASDRKSFYSSSQGASQRLPNGNTLICNSMSGQAFEVTASGERVWEYLAPYFNDEDQRAAMYRVRRYDVGYVDEILAAHATTASAK